jgi:hypothetical protein
VTREAFEHAIRAAGGVLGVREVLVLGSQALHASVPGSFPEEITPSIEVDIAVRDDSRGELADLVDGSIGEGSMFHETFGYYAQGVVEATAKLPRGWRDRLVRFETPSTNGVVAWCLEPHDLWVSKAVAGRPKDVDYCAALLDAGIVEPDLLRKRMADVEDIPEAVRQAAQSRIPG